MTLQPKLYLRAFLLVLASATTPVRAQIITIDGTTPTSVTTNAAGNINIGVAPADVTGVSYNAFSAFSVPSTGVSLDNNAAAASTIVNEVTSLAITTINGELLVLGPQADVIVANPNGININGGSFVNIRNLAFTTGGIGRDSSNRLISSVDGGSITVGPQGLAATVEELDLISRSLSINGTVAGNAGGEIGTINMMAGESVVNFDPSRSGGFLPWAFYTDRGASQTDAVIVNLGNNANLSAGGIFITVTDAGAGVQMAGDSLAGVNGFRLSSSGKLDITGGSISSEGSVNIKANEIVISPDSPVEITSNASGVVLEAQTGDIQLGQADISGATIASDNLASVGGITVIAQGDIVGGKGQDGVTKLTSSDSLVALFADGNISFDGLVLDTYSDFRLSAGGNIDLSFVTGNVTEDFRVISNGNILVEQTVLEVGSDIRFDGARLRFGAEDASAIRTELTALTGGMVLKAGTGGIVNYGSLLQGFLRDASDAEAMGGVTILSDGDFQQRGVSPDSLAVSFSQFDDLYIDVAGNIINETGRLFSNRSIFLVAGGDVINTTFRTGVTHDLQIVDTLGPRDWRSLWLKPTSVTSASVAFGERVVEDEVGYILAIGDVTITAQNIINDGAELKGANVMLLASGVVENRLGLSGGYTFSRVCGIFCKVTGSSDLAYFSGNIEASDTLTIVAGEEIINYAGAFIAENDIELSAPITRFTPVTFGSLIERPAGLFGWATGAQYWMTFDRIDGFIGSSSGQIFVDGDLQLNDARGFEDQTPTVTGELIEADEFVLPAQVGRKPIGWLWTIF